MAVRSHRRWSNGLFARAVLSLTCVLLLAAPASPALAAAGPSPDPTYQMVKPYDNPTKPFNGLVTIGEIWAVLHDLTSGSKNIGVSAIDTTGMTPDEIAGLAIDPHIAPVSFWRFQVDHQQGMLADGFGVDHPDWQAILRQAYQDLQLGQRAAAVGSGPVTSVTLAIVPNDAGADHSEARYVQQLMERGYAPRFLGGSTSRAPCATTCQPALRSLLAAVQAARPNQPAPRISAEVPYDDGKSAKTPAQKKAAAATRKDANTFLFSQRQALARSPLVKQLKARAEVLGKEATGILKPGGPCPPGSGAKAQQPVGGQVLAAAVSCGPEASSSAGALAQAVSSPATSTPGGIDFSSLELRYLADGGPGRGVRYAFQAPPTTGAENRDAGLRVTSAASDAFFVWLEVDPSKFWVNLNPTEPDRIIDPSLGRTDAGRAMLEADLAMKKTTAQLIHPDTPLGAQFWSQLTAGSDKQTCLSMRQWIVPAPATVREVDDQLYILDAPLSVKMESDYLQGAGVPQQAAASCPPQDKAVEQHNEAVFRALILPRVEQAVNTAPEYADLRRAYLSRVAAEWYRRRSATAQTAYGDLVDRGNVTPWASKQPWNPKDVFDRYVESYTKGEFNVTHTTQQGNVITTRTYVFGGVDFTNMVERKLSAADFQRQHPGLAASVSRAGSAPAADPSGHVVWLGGTTAPPKAANAGFNLTGALFAAPILVWIVGVLAAVAVVGWAFAHRRA